MHGRALGALRPRSTPWYSIRARPGELTALEEARRHTAVHELIHIIARGVGPSSGIVDDAGAALPLV